MSYLYCISNDSGLCKFGFSGEPTRRLKSLQTGSSSRLELVHSVLVEGDVREMERLLHREFGHKRVRGEWFACTAEEGVNFLQWFEIRYL